MNENHSDLLENAVLGAILIDNNVYHITKQYLQNSFPIFYHPKNDKIYKAISCLIEKNGVADIALLYNLLKGDVSLDELNSLSYSVATTVNAVDQAKELFNLALKRKLLKEIKIAVEVNKGNSYDLLIKNLQSAIDTNIPNLFFSENGIVPLKSALENEVKNNIDDILSGEILKNVVPTGFISIDDVFYGGLRNGEMYILAARPGMGKTSLAINMAYNMALKKYPVLFFSIEMSLLEISKRFLFSASRITENELLYSKNKNNYRLDVDYARASLSNLPLYIDVSPALTIDDIRIKLAVSKRKNNIKAVFIDYLQLIRSNKKFENRQNEVAFLSSFLKQIAKEFNVPVVVLAQLNRQVEHANNTVPKLSNLRESGAIEQDADVVIFIHHRKSDNSISSCPYIETDIIIAKNRNGATGNTKMIFFPKYTLFCNLYKKRGGQ